MSHGPASGGPTGGKGDLGELGGLARARLATDDENGVLLEGLGNLQPMGTDRQLGVEDDAELIGPLVQEFGSLGGRHRKRHCEIILSA